MTHRTSIKNPRNPLWISFFAITLFAVTASLWSGGHTQAGTFDPSFGTSGRVTLDVAFSDFVRRVFVLSDGKILVAGEGTTFFGGNFGSWPFMARFNSNGTLDTTFGSSGKVFGDGGIRVLDVFLQPDGKIVFAGGVGFVSTEPTNDLALARYNADGSKDLGFGSAGRVSTSISSLKESAGSVVMLSDGKLLVAGGTAGDATHTATIDLVRYTTSGGLDGTFGTGGFVAHPYAASGTQNPMITGLAVLPGDKLLARGPGFVARFNADGSLDTTFDGDGIRTDSLSAKYLTVQPDGRYIIAGTSTDVVTGNTWTLNRFNSDGTVDTTFGISGVVQTNFTGPGGVAGALVGAVSLRSNGEIIAVGSTIGPGGFDPNMAVARYAADGTRLARTLVPYIPDNGETDAFGKALAIQPDDKVVLAAKLNFGPTNPNVGLARLSTITNDLVGARRNYDYNGDGRDDITVYRPGTGGGSSHWYSSSYPFPWFTYGVAEDIITPGDYNGDGKSDLAVFRPSVGVWYIASQVSNPDSHTIGVHWGTAGDVPAAGDFDGDGKTDVAVFRPSNGVWYIRGSETGSVTAVQWGTNGDRPVVGDYDADGKADVAVYRPSMSTWYILKSGNGQMLAYAFGAAGDVPVPADYDGDGVTDVSVFRPSDGIWYRSNSLNGSFFAQPWGASGDVPAPGDYDGDGKTDVAVYRNDSGQGTWYILRSNGSGMQSVYWGLGTDTPVPGN